MSDTPVPARRLPAPRPRSLTAEGQFARLVEIMQLLRSPDGCPWDLEQSWQSLAPFVLEETCEVLDAIDRDDAEGLCGEVGDLVFEGVFLAQVAADRGAFSIADALSSVCEKLIRRHPHVFVQTDPVAGTDGHGIDTPGAVVTQWAQIKARERAAAGTSHDSALDGVPLTLPALARAAALGARAARQGFDWPDAAGVLEKVREEVDELRVEHERGDPSAAAEELGDLLFALAQYARKTGLDPEAALRRANAKFTGRFQTLERTVAESGRSVTDLSLAQLEEVWQQVKQTT